MYVFTEGIWAVGWTPITPRIETLRNGLAVDPAGVRRDVTELLATTTVQPADHLRLIGLIVAANRKLGDLTTADAIAADASMIATRSPIAQADFLLHVASLRIVQAQPTAAHHAVDSATRLLTNELNKPAPSAKESLRRRRWMHAAIGVAHVTRGEIYLHLSDGTIDGAFADAFAALRLTADLVKAPAYTRRVHMAAITLLCALLVRFGTPALVTEATKLLDHAEHVLIYRCRIPPDHVHRIKLTWCRALTHARLDAFHKAETLLIDVIDQLLAHNWHNDATRALHALIWVIEQTSMPARATYYTRKYRHLTTP